MTAPRIYLDHNATSPIRPEAAHAVVSSFVAGGNPSSVHGEGRNARKVLEKSREAVAAMVGAEAKNVAFTGSATEALNLALTPSLTFGQDERPWRLYLSATEHPAVLNGHRFPADSVEVVSVNAEGLFDIEQFQRAADASAGTRPLLALQFANSETGIIQPVRAAADSVKARGGLLVCDAVQAAGRIHVNLGTLGADLLVLSAHKLGGPPGAGALIRASGAIHIAEPLVRGGGQEKGLRAGTENVPASAGFAAACSIVSAGLTDEAIRLRTLRDRFEAGLRALDPVVTIFGSGVERLPNTTAFSFEGLKAETALIALDLAGFAVSSGSACSSGKVGSSHVLEAMGVGPDIARGMLRVSFGWTTVENHVDQFLEALARLRANSSATGKVLVA